ncbi:MAG TPA: hypothetical protein VJ728_11730 [Candidatus Binataceae bacterium]|nr:hypothetical protein [Candidatus Binataceae bacterium]
MTHPERTFITSLLACLLFGYAVVTCLVFYRRMRQRISEYKEPGQDGPSRVERVVHSPQYGATIWLTGAIGIVGFVIASWTLVMSLLAMLHGS